MSQIELTKKLPNGETLYLLKLSDDWLPWRYQIRREVPDGAPYDITFAGKPCFTSMANYETLDKAQVAFDRDGTIRDEPAKANRQRKPRHTKSE